MSNILFNIGYGHFLVLGAVLFLIGVRRRAGAPQRADHPDERRAHAQRRQRHAARVLADVGRPLGHTFALIVIAVAAAEAAVGLAIVSRCSVAGTTSTSNRLNTLRH